MVWKKGKQKIAHSEYGEENRVCQFVTELSFMDLLHFDVLVASFEKSFQFMGWACIAGSFPKSIKRCMHAFA